jgi:hypothetical protein
MNIELMSFPKPTSVPHELAASLLERSVPNDMLERYQAASELTLVEVPGRGQLVCFGTVMGSHRICLDPHTGAIIAIIDGPPGDEWAEWPINSSLEQFIASVGAVLNRYPFDNPQAEEESDDSYLDRTHAELDRAVDDLKRALSAIDPAAMEDLDGFWMTFLDDVQMRDFST